MNTELKYIMMEGGQFLIFTTGEKHVDVARAVRETVVGAGFCNIRQEADSDRVSVHCYGRSVSLGVESRTRDEEIINRTINPPR